MVLSLMDICSGVYKRMINNSIKRGHDLPSFSEIELYKKYFCDDNAKVLLKQYIDSFNGVSFNPQLSLTIDRLDNSKGYYFDNIRGLFTFYDNACFYQKERRIPCNIYKYHNGVLVFIGKKDSLMEAAGFISSESGEYCDHSMVKSCCNRRINYTCGVYTARFYQEGKSSQKNLKSKCSPGSKPKKNIRVGKYCSRTGALIKEYDSMTLAAESVKGYTGEIGRVCRGDRNSKTYKGFSWRYL